MQVGIIGGTFDPIHLGHLIIAEEARTQLELEQAIFIPTGQPWLKAGRPLTQGQDRLNMVRLAIASNPYFRAGSHELDRPGPSYTVDTLAELREELGPSASLHFILGRDALEQFHQWKDPERLLGLCNLVVVNRPGYPNDDFSAFTHRYPQAAGKVTPLLAPLIDISATEIRRRAAAGISFRYHVPEAVEQYILQHQLYRPISLPNPVLQRGINISPPLS
jgi:nicotinate-nucleotide adenylyltransferase